MMLMLCAIRSISLGVFGTKTGGNKKPIAVPSCKARKENQKSFPGELNINRTALPGRIQNLHNNKY